MKPPSPSHHSRLAGSSLGLLLVALGASGCDDDIYVYGYYPVICDSGVSEGTVDTGAILELAPGEGVGATAEYFRDGAWRFAVTCDTYLSGYACDWTILVEPLDGTIDDFAPEGLEPEDLVERFPTSPESREEDGVILYSLTDVGIDAFTLLATPGVGMRVTATIGGSCGGPFLFWTEQGDVRRLADESNGPLPESRGIVICSCQRPAG